MAKDSAEALSGAVASKGVGVVVEARHLCMEMRGVQKPGGQLITSCMLGTFREDARTRAEHLDLIRRAWGTHPHLNQARRTRKRSFALSSSEKEPLGVHQ